MVGASTYACLRAEALAVGAKLRLRLRLQWLLPLTTATDAAAIGGYGCFYVLPLQLLAPAAVPAPW